MNDWLKIIGLLIAYFSCMIAIKKKSDNTFCEFCFHLKHENDRCGYMIYPGPGQLNVYPCVCRNKRIENDPCPAFIKCIHAGEYHKLVSVDNFITTLDPATPLQSRSTKCDLCDCIITLTTNVKK